MIAKIQKMFLILELLQRVLEQMLDETMLISFQTVKLLMLMMKEFSMKHLLLNGRNC